MSSPPSIGICTVATRMYAEHWARMAESADEMLFRDREVTLNVFTDQADYARRVGASLHRARVRVFEIPSLAWPEATILRYQLIRDHSDAIAGDILMHLDADMLIASPVGAGLNPDAWRGGLALVEHPGYHRPPGIARAALYAAHPKMVARDLRLLSAMGGLGAWETRAESRAHVSRDLRSRYYCGGVWFGSRSAILEMSRTLASRVTEDEEAGITAAWHDESHLNRYATEHPHTVLGPEYCYAPGYAQLKRLKPLIIAVDKGADWSRA